MRFRSLHLKAYGGFTDRRLEFGSGKGHVDIVLGANEAGKSTALRAIESLCFGFGTKTSDNHLHSNERLRVGAEIEMADGSCQTLYRRKGTKNTVLGPDDQSVPDEFLERCLCGIGPSGFSALFCLDFNRITTASEGLLDEGGEVGKLLFEARSDVSLRPILKELQARAQELYTGTRSKAVIDSSLRKYDELRKDSNRSDLGQYKEREKHLHQLNEQLIAEQEFVAKLRQEESRLTRFCNAYEPISRRTSLLDEIQLLGDDLQLPVTFSENLRNALDRLARGNTTSDERKAAHDRISSELNLIVLDDSILKWESEIDSLHEQTGNIAKMILDLPAERSKVAINRESISREITRLWATKELAPLSDSIGALERRKLRSLEATGTDLHSKMAAIRAQMKECEHSLSLWETDLNHIGEPEVPEAFGTLVMAAKALGDIDSEVHRLNGELADAELQVDSILSRLNLSGYDLHEIVRWPVPEVTSIRRHETFQADFRREIALLKKQVEDAKTKLGHSERERRALLLVGSVPTEEDLTRAREDRQELWLRLPLGKQQSSPPVEETKALFEASVTHADEIADRLRREADRTAQLAKIDADIISWNLVLSDTNDSIGKANLELEICIQDWSSLWSVVPTNVLTPTEMLAWRETFDWLCEAHIKIENVGRNYTTCIQDRTKARDELYHGLGEVGAVETLAPVLRESEMILSRSNERRNRRSDLLAQVAREKTREKNLQTEKSVLQRQIDAWTVEWSQAISVLQLGNAVGVNEVSDAIEILEGVAILEKEVAIAEKRAFGMERDIREFEERVQRITSALGMDQSLPAVVTAKSLSQRMAEAHRLVDARRRLKTEIERVEKDQIEAQAMARAASVELQRLSLVAGCSTFDELIPAEQRHIKRSALASRLVETNETIRSLSGGATIDQFCSEVLAEDPDRLKGLLEAVSRDLIEKEARLGELNQKIGEARRTLAETESSGNLLRLRSEAEAELAKARSSVRPFLVYNLAEALVSAQVEEFRKANQGPILERAGSIFSTLTNGSFAKLSSDLNEKDKPVLAAIRSNGEKVSVEGLSSATRVGLYLALRLACLYHHAELRECLPFVADDILLDFDNDRARCAFRALGELSQRTQVILFTHHAHLAAIGKDVLGDSAVVCNLQ